MSFFILEPRSRIKKIQEFFTITEAYSPYVEKAATHLCCSITPPVSAKGDYRIQVPMGVWRKYYETPPNDENNHPRARFTTSIQLLTAETDPLGRARDQNVACAEVLEYLERDRVCGVDWETGFGKTKGVVWISAQLQYVTVILSLSIGIRKQWEEVYRTQTTARVKMVGSENILEPGYDVYIIGTRKAQTIPRSEFAHVGLVIYDEMHIDTKNAMSNILLKIEPRYLLGLSATIRRADGTGGMFDFYFGDNIVVRHRPKACTVIKCPTGIEPSLKTMMVRGDEMLDYTHMRNSIEENPVRQQQIIDIVRAKPTTRFMILSKLVKQSRALFQQLKDAGESVTLYIGTTKHLDRSARILVIGLAKGGVGLDVDADELVMASDAKDVEQYVGRLRKVGGTIYDFVDNHPLYENHWKLRMKLYETLGFIVTDKNGNTIEYARRRNANNTRNKKGKQEAEDEPESDPNNKKYKGPVMNWTLESI